MSDSYPTPPPESDDMGPLEPTPIRPVYAGFWRRVAAFVVDFLVIVVPAFVLSLVFFTDVVIFNPEAATGDVQPPQGTTKFLVFQIAVLLLWIVYRAGLESSRFQATLGKQLLGILVTDRKYQRASFGQCFLRGWFYWLPGIMGVVDTLLQVAMLQLVALIVSLVSCVMVAFTARKQGLHDIMVQCFVLRRSEARS